jgi:hypothetical protein
MSLSLTNGTRTLNDSKSNLKSDNSSADAELTADVEKPSQTPGPPQFPEGGLQAWLTVLGGYVPSLYVSVRPPFHMRLPRAFRVYPAP